MSCVNNVSSFSGVEDVPSSLVFLPNLAQFDVCAGFVGYSILGWMAYGNNDGVRQSHRWFNTARRWRASISRQCSGAQIITQGGPCFGVHDSIRGDDVSIISASQLQAPPSSRRIDNLFLAGGHVGYSDWFLAPDPPSDDKRRVHNRGHLLCYRLRVPGRVRPPTSKTSC